MRMSCNGCRVLRKGCSESCSIRPCLEWIKSSESQANATVFLAKFYGRAGLMNLINAGPPHLRPAIFRSLLYEACGRIVNPTYGSVGLMWSGSWQLCHSAVEAVLRGAPVTQMATDAAEAKIAPLFKAYDIRHVNKVEKSAGSGLHRVRNRCGFKRSGARSKRVRASEGSADESGSLSHESSLSHQSAAAVVEPSLERESRESESLGSALDAEEGEIKLELTLGFEPISRCVKMRDSAAKPKRAGSSSSADGENGFCEMDLRLECPALVIDGSD